MIATVSGNFGSMGAADAVPKNTNGPFSRLEESSDTDKNAGQHTTAPYLAELRRNGMQEKQESPAPRRAQDPLGRGELFDYMA